MLSLAQNIYFGSVFHYQIIKIKYNLAGKSHGKMQEPMKKYCLILKDFIQNQFITNYVEKWERSAKQIVKILKNENY